MKTTAGVIIILVLVTAASIFLANQAEPIGLPPQYQNTPFSPENPAAVPTRKPEPTRTIPQYPTPYIEDVILVVRVNSVNIHASPEYSGQVTGWLHQNDQVILEFCSGEWAKLQGSGWVMGTCFETNPCGKDGSCQ